MLELKSISRQFGQKRIFDHFSLATEDGKILSLVGPSGSGKTTLLRMLAGLEKIDSERVIYNNEVVPIDRLGTLNSLGFVFQDFQLFPHLSVLDNLILSPVKTVGMTKETIKKKAATLLQRLGLDEHADAYPYSLSGGQKQCMALTCAMIIDPQVIGCDESTSALDPELRQEVEKLILRNHEAGMTQIVTTHDLQSAGSISDHILKINPK